MDAAALERDAVQFARLAVQRDHEGRYSEAVFYYKVGWGRAQVLPDGLRIASPLPLSFGGGGRWPR